MNGVTRTDGNVIHADFGRGDDAMTVGIAAAAEVLYADELVTVGRVIIDINGERYVQHVMVEADA